MIVESLVHVEVFPQQHFVTAYCKEARSIISTKRLVKAN